MGAMARRVLEPLRLLAKLMLQPELSYIGSHGCLRTGASFATWNQVEGDYLEFGVFRGESFIAAYRALAMQRRAYTPENTAAPEYLAWKEHPPRFFAFDSFEGLPGGTAERQTDYFAGSYGCSEKDFKANIAADGVDLRRVVTVPGFYDRTLTPETKRQHRLTRAALVMIDCDLYESTVPVLDFLTDLVGQGTVIVFHDWFRFKGNPNAGEQRACREWLARNPQLELIEHWREGPQAISFIVSLK
jgi:hypothetical protein